jgi:26S proteasome regulatory subunit N1
LQDKSEVFLESVKALPEPFGSMTATLVDVCAYAGTGSVDKVQQMLHICSEHYEPAKEEAADKTATGPKSKTGGLTLPLKSAVAAAGSSTTATADGQPLKEKMDSSEPTKVDYSSMQSVAVLGIALVTMGEDIGSQMVLRTFGHLVRAQQD